MGKIKTKNNNQQNNNITNIISKKQEPEFGLNFKQAFRSRNILFGGMARKYLYWEDLNEKDLVINLYGEPLYNNVLVESSKEFTNLFQPKKFYEICLRIPDGSFLWPQEYNLSFWQEIINKAESLGIERIICCCFAGIGRTGTALAAFHMAETRSLINSHWSSIDAIREHYYRKAIETSFQEKYLEYIYKHS